MFHTALHSRALIILAAGAASLLPPLNPSAQAETWNLAVGGSWNTAANWSPATIPDGVGASAVFNGLATANNPAQTANRSITLDVAKTVGSILFNNDVSFTNTIATGTAGPLTFDAAGTGPATIVTTGTGTGNNTISVATVLTDSVIATVDNVSASSAAGSLNLTTAMSGPGGFTKAGDGLATFGTGAKTYTGHTVLNGGRLRMSLAAQPSATSSFTINAGAQLDPISASAYTLGLGNVILNGSGATSGPFAAFPGAIRQDTNLAVTINNPIVLQSDTLLHVQGAASGSLTLPSPVSGIGRLTFTAAAHNEDLGTLILQGANTYSGGTLVNGGNFRLSGANATAGTGDVFVVTSSTSFAAASAKMTIDSGVLNGIADTATLSLAGGKSPGIADDGFIFLSAGVNEFVGGLLLSGAAMLPGTYGSTGSGATFIFDDYFSGPGIVTVVPEPGSLAIMLGGFGVLAARRRRR